MLSAWVKYLSTRKKWMCSVTDQWMSSGSHERFCAFATEKGPKSVYKLRKNRNVEMLTVVARLPFQMTEFRRLHFGGKGSPCMCDNYRPPQELRCREVCTSWLQQYQQLQHCYHKYLRFLRCSRNSNIPRVLIHYISEVCEKERVGDVFHNFPKSWSNRVFSGVNKQTRPLRYRFELVYNCGLAVATWISVLAMRGQLQPVLVYYGFIN